MYLISIFMYHKHNSKRNFHGNNNSYEQENISFIIVQKIYFMENLHILICMVLLKLKKNLFFFFICQTTSSEVCDSYNNDSDSKESLPKK